MSKNPPKPELLRDDWRQRRGEPCESGSPTGESVRSNGFNDWLDAIEDVGLPPLHPSELDSLPNIDAPLLATWMAKHVASAHVAEQARLVEKLQGPHADIWRDHASIETEVERLACACRTSTGIERESNLRQLRDAESELTAFRRTHEFREALGCMLNQLDAAVVTSDGKDLSEPQAEARAWYECIRARMTMPLANDYEPADAAPEAARGTGPAREEPGESIVTLKPGRNSRPAVDAWIKKTARELRRSGELAKPLAERIELLADKCGYESERGPITRWIILKNMDGLTGGRGRRSTKTREN